jgi:hypothetical protein
LNGAVRTPGRLMPAVQTFPAAWRYRFLNAGHIKIVIFVTLGGGVTHASSHDRNTVNKIFGSELPQEATDERDPDASRDDDERNRWLRDNVPPHHI